MAFDWTQGSAPPPVNITQAHAQVQVQGLPEILDTCNNESLDHEVSECTENPVHMHPVMAELCGRVHHVLQHGVEQNTMRLMIEAE